MQKIRDERSLMVAINLASSARSGTVNNVLNHIYIENPYIANKALQKVNRRSVGKVMLAIDPGIITLEMIKIAITKADEYSIAEVILAIAGADRLHLGRQRPVFMTPKIAIIAIRDKANEFTIGKVMKAIAIANKCALEQEPSTELSLMTPYMAELAIEMANIGSIAEVMQAINMAGLIIAENISALSAAATNNFEKQKYVERCIITDSKPHNKHQYATTETKADKQDIGNTMLYMDPSKINPKMVEVALMLADCHSIVGVILAIAKADKLLHSGKQKPALLTKDVATIAIKDKANRFNIGMIMGIISATQPELITIDMAKLAIAKTNPHSFIRVMQAIYTAGLITSENVPTLIAAGNNDDQKRCIMAFIQKVSRKNMPDKQQPNSNHAQRITMTKIKPKGLIKQHPKNAHTKRATTAMGRLSDFSTNGPIINHYNIASL